jgi:hypothetical protein
LELDIINIEDIYEGSEYLDKVLLESHGINLTESKRVPLDKTEKRQKLLNLLNSLSGKSEENILIKYRNWVKQR